MSDNQCALDLDQEYQTTGTCLSKPFLAKLAKATGKSINKPKETLLVLAKEFGVRHPGQPDADLLKSKQFRQKTGLDSEADEELAQRFKPEGPALAHTWLTNWDIADVLQQYKRRFHFFDYLESEMMDFQDYENDLRHFSPTKLKPGITCFACVLNTDKHTGSGKHWVTLFCDMRRTPGTVEYFNSANNSAPREVIKFFERLAQQYGGAEKKQVEYHETAGSISHQRGNSECGMFSLYYVWHRLHESLPLEYSSAEGKANRFALKSRIDDKTAFEFRAKVFLLCESCRTK
jgi:hypothetical protein